MAYQRQRDVAPWGGCRIDSRATGLWLARGRAQCSRSDVIEALQHDAVARRILAKGCAPRAGEFVGVRLNLNVLKATGIPVQTLHAGNQSGGHQRNKGFYRGAVLAYEAAVTLRDAYFNVHQKAREEIASGRAAKSPMASVDGILTRKAPSLDGVEVRFNPMREHLFTDTAHRPIRWAQEVTICGHRAYVRGEVEYYTPASAPEKAGDALSAVIWVVP